MKKLIGNMRMWELLNVKVEFTLTVLYEIIIISVLEILFSMKLEYSKKSFEIVLLILINPYKLLLING